MEFEVETGPVMEIKWNRVTGRFSHKSHLRRLAGLQKHRLKKTFQQAKLPATWEKALEGYDVDGFIWQSETISGKGVLLYGTQSRVATLIQFHHQHAAAVERAVPRLLASFRDQVTGDDFSWEVFDIRATIPVEFELKRFRFQAGRYELNFSSARQQLQMLRFSPAAVLLGRRDLAAMAAESFYPGQKNPPRWLSSDAATVEGRQSPGSAASRIASRIRRRPAYRICRLWHEIEKNRILGVQLSGRDPVDRRQFSAICETYETL